VAGTAARALELAERLDPDLILLDLHLPDGDGRDVCRTIRARSGVPIIILTARGTETDRIVGLELGADDYVVKPFSGAEVIARIRAVLRRATPSREEERPQEPTAEQQKEQKDKEDEVDWEEIRELVVESYCRLAPQKLVRLVDRPPGGPGR